MNMHLISSQSTTLRKRRLSGKSVRCDSSRERRSELSHKLIDNSSKTLNLRKSMREAGKDLKAPKVKAKNTSLMRNLSKAEVKAKVKLVKEVLKVKDQRAPSQ